MTTAADHPKLERVYVWEIPVRLCHWVIVGSVAVLAITGLYIGNPFLPVPGQASRHFVMGTIKSIHFVAGLVFALAVFYRLLWMFAGNPYAQWHQFLPVTAHRFKGIWQTFKFYTFLSREPPAFIGHNPLAGAVYVVVFLLLLGMIGTGFALASAGAHTGSILSWFQFLIPWFGGLQMARFLHHVGMWLVLGFAAHHVWSAFLIGTVEKNGLMDSIFSGYKVLPPRIADRARNTIEDEGGG